MRSLGNEIPSYAVSVVGERQEPLLLNKWFNCNPELFLPTPFLDVRYTWIHTKGNLYMHVVSTYLININKSGHVITISSVIYAIKYYHNLHGNANLTDCNRLKFLQDASKHVMNTLVIKKDIISPDNIKSLFAKYHSSDLLFGTLP